MYPRERRVRLHVFREVSLVEERHDGVVQNSNVADENEHQ